MQRRMILAGVLALIVAGGARPALAGIVPETLQDGTKIEIDGDKVFRMRTGDGSVKPADATKARTALADGVYKTKSGKTLEIKNGKLVAPAQR